MSTTAKPYKTGIKNAKKNQTYFNTDTGHIYKCTEGGKPKDAKWKYTKTGIAKKPTGTVSKLITPARTGTKYKSTWAVGAALTKATSGSRAQNIKTRWTVSTTTNKKKKSLKVANTAGTGYVESTLNINSFKSGKTTYTRDSFWPMTKRKLNSITIAVAAKNSKGTGKWASKTIDIKPPRKPTFSDWSFNTENGELSITINTNAGEDRYERYDTYWEIVYTNTRTGNENKVYNSGTTESTSYTAVFDAGGYQALSYDQYIKVTVSAYARGLQGNSETVSKDFYIGYPMATTIKDVDFDSNDSRGKLTAYINTNYAPSKNVGVEHPVDRVRLEYLANVPYSEERLIPGDAGWEASAIMDDGNCTALAIPVADVLPDKGNYTWIRVKSWHANEAVLFRYSNYKLTGLEEAAPTAADDDITIISAAAGTDGETIVVHLGWNKDGQDDSTGTELTWAEEEDTWRSTEEPSNHEFTWSDGETYGLTQDTSIDAEKTYYTRSGTGTDADPYVYTEVASPDIAYIDTYYEKYLDSATITIKGLAEGTLYFIRARRYLEGENEKTYSKYSNQSTAFTSETPEAITASCDRYIPSGASLPVYWTFSGNGVQTKWQILTHNSTLAGVDYAYAPTTDGIVLAEGKTYYTRSGSGTDLDPYVYTEVADPNPEQLGIYYERYALDGTRIAGGEGSLGSTKLDASALEAFAYEGSLAFVVEARTGSEWVRSEVSTVSIIDAPTLSLSVDPTLTVNAMTFDATASRLCDLRVIISSLGIAGQFPQGVLNQVSGDTVHSDIYSPEWTVSGDNFTATVALPTGLDFWDTGSYTLSVVAIDQETKLQSAEALETITVAWDNQAVSPQSVETYTATADTEVDETKAYFEYDSEEGVYEGVVPEGDENPSAMGWFERTVAEFVTLTPIDTITDDGEHLQGVQIDLTPPAGSNETDVYDIYRMTGDGPRLIGENFPLTYSGIDEYAPFGDDMTHYYRIAIKTADGDVEFADFEYVLDCSFMRFDWGTGSLELPYNISIGDKYKKSIEVRSHMDGSIDGYWNPNIERSASMNSDVIRLTMQTEIDSARQLARYAGAVFVRTPDGSAYEADVQVTDLSTEGVISAISIDATEIGLTQEFILPTPYQHEEEE